eukprot:m.11173 g.11173  ORF g.11173 m.11173 type:complete len:614 (-) comp5681_c0_seq1:36-1877(-)
MNCIGRSIWGVRAFWWRRVNAKESLLNTLAATALSSRSNCRHLSIPFRFSVSSRAMATFSYEEAVQKLNSFQTNAAVLKKQREIAHANVSAALTRNLESFQVQVEAIGFTQEKLSSLRVVHVAGTKGKGSTATFAESILRQHGFKTGLFTSPHLIAARERVRINGVPLSREKFAIYVSQVCEKLEASSLSPQERYPPYFKFTVLLALEAFFQEEVDVAVLEVGLGGMYDATNVVQQPWVCGISHLGYDHTAILGTTLTSIAHQKAGIMKKHVPVYTISQDKEAMAELVASAQLHQPSALYHVQDLAHVCDDGQKRKLGIEGDVQYQNAALAVAMVRDWLHQHKQTEAEKMEHSTSDMQATPSTVSPESICIEPLTDAESLALESAKLPGRSQEVHKNGIRYLIDGSHTPSSCEATARWVRQKLQDLSLPPRISIIYNCTGDRDPTTMLQPMLELCEIEAAIFCSNVASAAQRPDQKNLTVDDADSTRQILENRESFDALWTKMYSKSKSPPSYVTASVQEAIQLHKSLVSRASDAATPTEASTPPHTKHTHASTEAPLLSGREQTQPHSAQDSCSEKATATTSSGMTPQHTCVAFGSMHLAGAVLDQLGVDVQ